MPLQETVAADMEAHADLYGERVMTAVAEALPGLDEDPERVELGRATCTALFREFAATLRHGLADNFNPPVAATALAIYLAEVGVPLEHLLRAYHIGLEAVVERVTALSSRSGGRGPTEGAERLVSISFRAADAAMTHAAGTYQSAREATLRSDLARRNEVVASLMTERDVDLAAAERVLGYRLTGPHVSLLCWRIEAGAGPAPLEWLAAGARGLNLRPLLLQEPGDLAAAWLPRAEPLDSDARDRLSANGLQVAAGEPGTGPRGFVTTRRQADRAMLVARLAGSAVTRYRDVSLGGLLLQDRDAAREFAREELGALADQTARAAALRETVAAYVEAGQDHTRAAAELQVHRNTVRRRLDESSELVGHPLNDRTSELMAALTIMHALAPKTDASRQHPARGRLTV